MQKFNIEPERKFLQAPFWLAWFIALILLAGLLTQTVRLMDAQTDLECSRIAAATAALAPEPARQYDNRLEHYKYNPKTKMYERKD
jgi:hypothetical protein